VRKRNQERETAEEKVPLTLAAIAYSSSETPSGMHERAIRRRDVKKKKKKRIEDRESSTFRGDTAPPRAAAREFASTKVRMKF
jgi:hypothetical protein